MLACPVCRERHWVDRAKNLLWAAGRLADWATGLGLEPVPEVLLHPSVIERFTAHAPHLTGVTRRTLRTNLRFLARAVVPQLCQADAPLPRERAKAPYRPAEIDGYLALADAQPAVRVSVVQPGLIRVKKMSVGPSSAKGADAVKSAPKPRPGSAASPWYSPN